MATAVARNDVRVWCRYCQREVWSGTIAVKDAARVSRMMDEHVESEHRNIRDAVRGAVAGFLFEVFS